jgi:hypothetical protein
MHECGRSTRYGRCLQDIDFECVLPRNPAIQREFRAKENDTSKQMTLLHL